MVHGTHSPLGILKVSKLPMFTLLLLLAEHLATSFLNYWTNLVYILDQPVNADASSAGSEEAGRVRGLLDAAMKAQGWVEVEHFALVHRIVGRLVLLEGEVEYDLVELGR